MVTQINSHPLRSKEPMSVGLTPMWDGNIIKGEFERELVARRIYFMCKLRGYTMEQFCKGSGYIQCELEYIMAQS